jgi:hypothetical protein
VQDYNNNKCDERSPMEINLAGDCRSPVISMPYEVDLVAFEMALVNAVQRTGLRLHYKNRKPKRVNGTYTGWARR